MGQLKCLCERLEVGGWLEAFVGSGVFYYMKTGSLDRSGEAKVWKLMCKKTKD
jgi:hypothetical protein